MITSGKISSLNFGASRPIQQRHKAQELSFTSGATEKQEVVIPHNITAAELLGRVDVARSAQKTEPQQQNFSKVNARHILVKTREEADKVKQEIDQGKSFTAAAVEYSMCPSKNKGGDLGYFGEGEMVDPFWQAAKALPVGKVSDPVETQFGFHLIQVTDKK